jgi:hypothetical protein
LKANPIPSEGKKSLDQQNCTDGKKQEIHSCPSDFGVSALSNAKADGKKYYLLDLLFFSFNALSFAFSQRT